MIDTTILELFEPAPNDYDSYLFKRLEHAALRKRSYLFLSDLLPL